MKRILLSLALMLMVNSAFAGYMMPKPKVGKDSLTLTLPTGTALYLMTIESFNVGAGLLTPTYGAAVNEDLVWGVNDAVNGAGSFTPIFGAGFSLYVDGSGPLAGNGPLVMLAALNLIGPDIIDLLGSNKGQGLTPNVLFARNFGTGECSIKGGLTLFTDLGPVAAVKVAGN